LRHPGAEPAMRRVEGSVLDRFHQRA
jgi:hypothetical protein